MNLSLQLRDILNSHAAQYKATMLSYLKGKLPEAKRFDFYWRYESTVLQVFDGNGAEIYDSWMSGDEYATAFYFKEKREEYEEKFIEDHGEFAWNCIELLNRELP